MAILTEDMKRVIRDQRLGFYATVCEDGSPNLSPKGTTCVLDDDHLLFADIRSPQTVANIRRGSLVEAGSTLVDRVKAIVVIEVRGARAVVSPAYDDGTLSEADVIRTFRARFNSIHGQAYGGLHKFD
jgi:predicted pyridoxine 5'-phosphate oxidase superfamily flavin-nucleotide-binding protein